VVVAGVEVLGAGAGFFATVVVADVDRFGVAVFVAAAAGGAFEAVAAGAALTA
jgi:hypothetical protein